VWSTPGEPDPGDPVVEVLAGAEAPVADRPRLLAVAAADVAKLYNSLSEADKEAFREAAKAGAAAQRKKVNDDENAGIAQLRSDGMTVVTNVDGNAFRTAMTPVWADFATKYGAENIRRIQEFQVDAVPPADISS